MPVAGPYYTKAEIEHAWILDGGNPARADVASAIAMAESSGGAGSWSANPGPCKTNWGLFQLCRVAVGNLLTLHGNVSAAIVQSKNGTDWCDWQTWDGRGCAPGNYTGAYKQFLRGAPPPFEPGPFPGPITPPLPAEHPLPDPSSIPERKWDYAHLVRASARAHQGHSNVIGVAARNVLTKLTRFRLPR